MDRCEQCTDSPISEYVAVHPESGDDYCLGLCRDCLVELRRQPFVSQAE